VNGSTIFIAGAYGTGKSTLCSTLSERLYIPAFSAGDLISVINGEKYGANKAVADKDTNQILLTERVQKLNRENERIILAGHFCIFNSHDGVEVLPESVYQMLNISQIILLEADVQTIIKHLKKRDDKIYSEESVSALLDKERAQSERVSLQLKCPLDIYRMTFMDDDLDHVAALLYVGE
jgi:adenylate kinase